MIRKDRNSKLITELSKNNNILIKSPEDVIRNLKMIIENFIYFLLIVAASAILISGIGLKKLIIFISMQQSVQYCRI